MKLFTFLHKNFKSNSLGIHGISPKHLNTDSVPLMRHLQLLLQMYVMSSVVPDSFLCGSVTSILKRGKDPNACNSYRPINVACFKYVLIPSLTCVAKNDKNQLEEGIVNASRGAHSIGN